MSMAPASKRRRVKEVFNNEDSDDGSEGVVLPTEAEAAGLFDPDRPDLDNISNTPKIKKDKQPRRQLFVRSLPSTTTSESLAAHFSESYPLKHATVVVDPVTKLSRGYAFVTFADADDAQRARDEYDGSKIDGKKIRVELSEPRQRDVVEITEDAATRKRSKPSEIAAQRKAEREKKQSEAKVSPKLIVRNLPWSIKKPDQLAELFRSFGKVKHSTIPSKKPGLMSGYGFIVMRGRRNAEKALAAINGMVVDGRTLEVAWAVEKETYEKSKEATGAGKEPSHKDESRGNDAVQSEFDDPDDELYEESDDGDGDDDEEGDVHSLGDDIDHFDASQDGAELGMTSAQPDRILSDSTTMFVRNLPFSTTDDSLKEHFTTFGPVRYARVVMDHATARPRGTGFVCFFNEMDADACLRDAPRLMQLAAQADMSRRANSLVKHSVLENEMADTTGTYTIEGRVLQISRAVSKGEAVKLTEQGHSRRDQRDRDKRRLYLLSEGTVAAGSPLYDALAPSEVKLREESAKQRKMLIQGNASLHLSLTRLSIRNLPRHIAAKDLKALAREAVVGFAKDVKDRKRQQLSKEEESRGGEEMRESERLRKLKGKGIVKQAKVVFEGREGSKVSEESGAGRSRGYGFVEYSSHRWALMGLRWLNGYSVGARPAEAAKGHPTATEDPAERKKRLIVEFAIENAQVVMRRREREEKARERSKTVMEKRATGELPTPAKNPPPKSTTMAKVRKGTKRKRDERDGKVQGMKGNAKSFAMEVNPDEIATDHSSDHAKLAKRQNIIAKKRMQRRGRKQGLASS